MQYVFAFAEIWLGGLSDILLSFAGVLIGVLAVGAFWDHRLRLIDLIVMLACCVMLIFSPLIYTSFHQFTDISQRMLGVVLLAITLGLGAFLLYLRRDGIVTEQGRCGARSSIFSDNTYGRSIRGTRVAVPILIALSGMAVLATGLSAPQVMIGDEVTHYYMLVNQAEDLSTPQFFAEIPVAGGDIETRRYPHPFGWHYLGAVLFSISGGAFAFIQLYHVLFFFQFLVVAYLLAKDRQGVESRSALVYVLLLASLPLTLIFSVAFYQDVPMTAQALTAFYLLRRGKWLWASIFMALAISFKVTAALFFPSFFLLLFCWQVKQTGLFRGMLVSVFAFAIVIGATWQIGRAIVTYGDAVFYPQVQLERVIKKTKSAIESTIPVLSKKTGLSTINTNLSARPSLQVKHKESKPPVIANHPGDLRITVNFLIYGGVLMWLVLAAGISGALYCRIIGSFPSTRLQSTCWLFFVGASYSLIAAWYIRTAPDARFFLPGIPFLLLPFVEKSVCLPKPKLFISIVAACAILQGSYVLQKAYHLRALNPDVKEAISFLHDHPPHGTIFMYPEGNYRFFPVQHEWYLGYRLREFWRADNDLRIELLQKYNVGALVIKKHLVSPVDEEITNLGVYPSFFVQEISEDQRFTRLFENASLLIYEVPE